MCSAGDFENKSWPWNETVNGLDLRGNFQLTPKIDKMNTTMTKISYGLIDNLDIYVKLGIARPETKIIVDGAATWTGGGPTNVHAIGRYKADTSLAYGAGIKGTLPLRYGLFVGCDAQYVQHKHGYGATLYGAYGGGGQQGEFYREWTGHYLIREWHVAPYVGQKITNLIPHTNFIPYVGMKYSDFRERGKDFFNRTESYRADDYIGFFGGLDCEVFDNLTLNIEGRVFDEPALLAALEYRF
jgi:hypothetical protein